MAKKISDLTPTTLQAGDEVEVYRPSSPSSDLRAPLAFGADTVAVAFAPTTYDPSEADVEAHLVAIDTALGDVAGGVVTDSVVTITGTTHTLDENQKARRGVLLVVDNANQNCLITMPDASQIGAWRIRSATTGTITIQRQTAGTIEGGTSVTMGGVGREAKLEVIAAPGGVAQATFEGETTQPTIQDADHNSNDKAIIAPELRDVAETAFDKGTFGSGAISFDYTAGGYQWGTTGAGNITNVAITNPPATGKLGRIRLEFVQGATPRTIAWGSAFRFPGGTDFALTASAGAVDIFTFITRNGGTTWYGIDEKKALAT